MVEDKGPSFTKMTTKQYIDSGEKELENEKFYEVVDDDKSEYLKGKSDKLIEDMWLSDEISEPVAKYLKSCDKKMPKLYHLLKTHKISPNVDDPIEWLENNGYPLRGIISGQGGPLERLGGFVDHFLQPGMKQLPSFLQDTKHTLQIIEEINQKVENEEVSLDGVAIVTLDVESMYNNMTNELARVASCEFLNGGRNSDQESLRVRTDSILQALDLCLKNNYFSFNEKNYHQIGGVGTGVKLAPPYACLGMGKFEKLHSIQILICLTKYYCGNGL